ncbi:secretin and TonB N-terminal domain-containing protein [Cesiribacter sp. SM1]|uniref:secretin and TonB N-terminal domain-containing protein n=1 Tax=Cesiribacter sp. SM1 TaxID=2861196 RepID=UPI001CD1BB90|nr:secretin and TonB N-terminal domain-containing protein [Cesiribacter sp. SM1]
MSLIHKTIVLGWLFLCLSLPVFAQVLQKKISISFKDVSLQTALEEIHTQHGIQFSYFNNDLPATPKVKLQLKNAPLDEVLERLLASTNLGYREHNGRIIISKNLPKKQASAVPVAAPAAPEVNEVKQEAPEPKEDDEEEEEEEEEAPAESAPAQGSQPEEPAKVPAVAPRPEYTDESPSPNVVEPPSGLLYASVDRAIFSKIETESDPEINPVHVGLVYPLSNLGVNSRQYVNRLSLHLLIGYSAGLEGVEASSIGNIENNYVQGAQFAGIFNVVNHSVRGVQASGFTNFSGDSLRGGQFGGFSNFTRNYMYGVQAGGFGNLAGSIYGLQAGGFGNITGDLEGAQLGGFGNIAADVEGLQAAGFGNIADSVGRGAQFGGFGNIAGSIKGVQAAGFGNIAGRVEGVQMAGFLNAASYVKGVQLGFINIADSMNGIPIGFLSIVKNGHRSLELWTADDFEANLAFKTGVERFYNIFAAGGQVQDPNRWGFGYGIGAQWRLSNRFRLNTDAISYHVFESGIDEGWDWEWELNQLSKFRLLAGWQFARHFSIFAGPTYNVMVSQVENEEGVIGSQLPSYSFYDETRGSTNVKMWIGFNAGVRF